MSCQSKEFAVNVTSQGWVFDPVNGLPSSEYQNPYPTVSAIFKELAPRKIIEELSSLFERCAAELGFANGAISVGHFPNPFKLESSIEIYFNGMPDDADCDNVMRRLADKIKTSIAVHPALNCIVS